ncbi:MAG: Tat pathway signal protein, partial [Caulobacteraceae bacterium]
MDRRQFLSVSALSAGALAAGDARANTASGAPPKPRLGPASAMDFQHWTPLASFEAFGRRWLVLEDISSETGAIAFLADNDQALVLHKRLEPVFSQVEKPYLGLDQKRVALAAADLLADKLLAAGGDPNMVEVRDAAPPPASDFKVEDLGARLAWTFFVGARCQNDTMPVTTKGSTRTYHVDQALGALIADPELVKRRHEGLLGLGLPAIVKVFPLADGRYYEVIVFGDVEDARPSIVQTWHRSRLVEDGKVTKAVYAHTYPACPPVRTPPEPASFYRALLTFAASWDDELQSMAETELPDAWGDMVRHAFVKEIMVRPGGVYPKYGAVDRDYMGSEYDGFQDTLTSSLYANLEWGRFKQARDVMDNYFTDFVRPNGDVNMRGPEIGQYGLTLALLARYLRYTGDTAVLARHAEKIAATAELLIALHEQSLALASTEPGYGLIHGWNESDSCLFPDPSVWWKPYFANSAFAARGLK